MNSFYVSAKSGDQINAWFYKIAADLAGVTLNKEAIETYQKVISANILNYMVSQEELNKVEEEVKEVKIRKEQIKKKNRCIIF